MLGANVGIYSSDADSWKLELTGRNLLNVHYMGWAVDRTGAPPGVTDQLGGINRPREIWLQLTKHFGP
jgi:hypothetical protein